MSPGPTPRQLRPLLGCIWTFRKLICNPVEFSAVVYIFPCLFPRLQWRAVVDSAWTSEFHVIHFISLVLLVLTSVGLNWDVGNSGELCEHVKLLLLDAISDALSSDSEGGCNSSTHCGVVGTGGYGSTACGIMGIGGSSSTNSGIMGTGGSGSTGSGIVGIGGSVSGCSCRVQRILCGADSIIILGSFLSNRRPLSEKLQSSPGQQTKHLEEKFTIMSAQFTVTQHAFRQHFDIHQNDSVPSHNTILLWVRNFRETACPTKNKPPGKQRTVQTPDNVERVHHAVLGSPRRSAEKQASALGISDRSVRIILHMDLHFHPYKIVIVQELRERDKRTHSVYCNELLTTMNDQVLNQLLMTDEANFHVCGYVNTHNCRFWASDNPQWMHERPLHSKKVVVWCGVASFGIIGPYFFEDGEERAVTVTSQHYINMLQAFLAPELRQGGIADVTWFQQDGATAHTSRASMGELREMFGARVISHRGDVQWPPRSPNLNA
ncbi:hypothetical protein ANN_16390 [Periplaneta americana]|uniref:DUF4817 domain-containing protein n=1 Tax=Periplaneta americana TaxID=6978 RepID=A0ABQ8SJU1_PERAM|nr:hypothetical protein ANN_16390 [Periplaneta americana]